MATRKKSKKKSTASKKSDRRKPSAKRPAHKQKQRKPTKLAKRKATSSKKASKKKAPAKTGRERRVSSSQSRGTSGSQAGDLQGLSNIETADSESVDELLEEGNAFEAGVVSGVEESRSREGKEVRTREVPEDDVPTEYLDED
jgi:hypothetical protein